MKTSKILLSSLLAATAMSTVPAWAVTSTTTELDGVTYSGIIWTTNVSGVNSGTNLSDSKRTYTSGETSYAGNASISGVGNFYNYFFNKSESTYVGNTLHLKGATADHTVTTDWTNYAWLGGLITDASDYTYTIGRSGSTNTAFRLKGTSGVNMSINADTVILGNQSNDSGASGISVESDGSWVIASGKTLTLQSSASVTFATGTTTTVSGGGTLKISGALEVAGTLSNAATLDLSGSKVTLASTITNTGTVTVNSSTVFVLADTMKSDSVYTVISGSGTVPDGSVLTLSNFRQSDGTTFAERSTVDVSTSGVVTVTDGAANLVWNGGASGTWDEKTTKNWIVGGSVESFYYGDNVTFNTADANVAVSGTVKPGTMTVSAATTLSGTGTVSVAAKNLTTSATLTLGDNVTLDLRSSADAVKKENISGTGTVKFTSTAAGHGGTLTLGEGFTGTIDYTGKFNTSNGTANPNAKFRLSGGSMWGTNTLSNDIHFLTNYQIGDTDATTITLNGKVTNEAGTTLTVGGTKPTVTFGGEMDVSTLKQTSGTMTFSGEGEKTISTLNISGGTTKISEGTTVSVGTLTGASAGTISGAGTIQSGSVAGNSITFSDWTGALAFKDISDVSGVGLTLSNFGNSNSKIVFDGVSGTGTGAGEGLWFNPGTYNVNVEIADGGLKLTNGYSASGQEVVLSGALSGTGTFEFSGSATPTFVFAGDVSEFSGTLKSSGSTFGFAGTSDQTFNGSISDSAKLAKSGTKTLTLTGENTYTGGTTISKGTLVAGSASALGTGKTTVAADAKLGLIAGTTVTVNGGVELADGAKILVDMSSISKAETFTLELLTGTALTYNSTTVSSTNVNSLLGDVVSLSNWDKDGWIKTLSFDDTSSKLSLTMTIPEPSTFGLLAGVGALAFVAARRRRRAK